jgi:uncharacterized protein (TIGR04255 family)
MGYKVQKSYAKAPIVEAIMHFKLQPREGSDVALFDQLHSRLKHEYPVSEELRQLQLEFTPASGLESTSPIMSNLGKRFTSEDRKQVVQIQLSSFTLHRLAPYTGWEDLKTEFKRVWELYTEVSNPEQLEGLSVRYINRLDLPLPIRDLRDYLRTYPELSSDMPLGITTYNMQLQVPMEGQNALSIINQRLVPQMPAEADVISIFLDIEVMSNPGQKISEPWSFLESLRPLKNDLFEACITNRMRELIS